MPWRNTEHSFGLLSRALHWGMMLLVIGMLALGNRISNMEPGLANLWLYGLHKSLGIITLGLIVARIIWHRISPPPRPIGPPGSWAVRGALAAHLAFYVLLLAIPVSGWVASSATGIDVMIFDRWTLPAIAPVSEVWEKRGFAAHDVLTKALFALIMLHILGAFKREMDGDGTLTRMIRGRAKP